jgi:hypothetical protein
MEYLVIYILGRGRSGSTVLDAVLGIAPQVESVGEVIVGLHNFPDELCSNGETIAESSFWSQVISRIEDLAGVNIKTFAEKLYHHAHLKNFLPTFFSSKSKSSTKELQQFNDVLYQAIHEVAAKSIVVDSGKELTRGLFLARFQPQVRFLHLVRNPIGFVSSYIHRIDTGFKFHFLRVEVTSKIKKFPFLRYPFLALIGLSWLIGNLIAELVKLISGRPRMFVRYEDFVANPTETIENFGMFTNCDISDLIQKLKSGSPMEVGPTIGGNEWRHSGDGTYVLTPKAPTRHKTPRLASWMTILSCWPLMWKYGYLKSTT